MKNKQNNGCSLNQWAQVIAAHSFAQPEEVPDGWLTTADIAKLSGISRATAARKIGSLISQGKAEKKTFRVLSGSRGVYPVPHFRLSHKSI